MRKENCPIMPELSTTTEFESRLRRFFGCRGDSNASPSKAAPQFERISSDKLVGVECPVCAGDGWLYCGKTSAVECSRCDGKGRLERSIRGAMVPRSGYVRCQKCHGVVGGNSLCDFCGGHGYSSVHAAFCEHEEEAIAYIDDSIQLFVEQREMLALMSHLDDRLRSYSERYYGPDGDRWARSERGRLFALYDLTRAGKRLLRKSPKAHHQLTPTERIAMLAEADKRIPAPDRTELLSQAYWQARELLEQFVTAWSAIVGVPNA